MYGERQPINQQVCKASNKQVTQNEVDWCCYITVNPATPALRNVSSNSCILLNRARKTNKAASKLTWANRAASKLTEKNRAASKLTEANRAASELKKVKRSTSKITEAREKSVTVQRWQHDESKNLPANEDKSSQDESQ